MDILGIVTDEDGHQVEGTLRPNGTVVFTVGRLTRHINLADFAELDLKWKPHFTAADRDAHDPIRFFRITGEGLA